MSERPIVVGSDHAAIPLRRMVVDHLRGKGLPVEDVGVHSAEPVDYPDYAMKVASRVVGAEGARGVLLCGTGIGVSIAANKIPGVRAAVCHDVTTARLARLHNDANIICFGGRTTGTSVALDMVDAFLSTEFEGGRHQRRIDKIHALEKEPAR